MIQITLAHSDLARVRFAHSPVNELVASLRVLAAVEPVWQRLYAVCTADPTYRMEQFAGGGLERRQAGLVNITNLIGDESEGDPLRGARRSRNARLMFRVLHSRQTRAPVLVGA